eukprot:224472-Hanusia_phi.AAC.5
MNDKELSSNSDAERERKLKKKGNRRWKSEELVYDENKGRYVQAAKAISKTEKLPRVILSFSFSHYMSESFLHYMENPAIDMRATELPTNASMALKARPCLIEGVKLSQLYYRVPVCFELSDSIVGRFGEFFWPAFEHDDSQLLLTGTKRYGDIAPVSYLGRIIVVGVMIIGTLYISAVTATFGEHLSFTNLEQELMHKVQDASCKSQQRWLTVLSKVENEQWQYRLAGAAASVLQVVHRTYTSYPLIGFLIGCLPKTESCKEGIKRTVQEGECEPLTTLST